jgi:transposase
MPTIVRSETLFVGVDVHKETHTAVGLSPFGEKIFEMTIGNELDDFRSLIQRSYAEAKRQKLIPHFGLEDVKSYGERLSTFLLEQEEPVVVVAPILVDRERKRTTHPEKSDSLDAHGVALVMIQKIDTLPAYTVTEEERKAKQIRELSVDREWLVKEQTRLKNLLHVLLHRIHNSEYQKMFKNPFSKKALEHWTRFFPKGCDSILASRTKRALNRLQTLREDIAAIRAELEQLLTNHDQTLTTAAGCGPIIAAQIIGEIGDIKKFKSPGALAKYAGCAPRQHSSGKTTRWRKTRSGNRRLNRAFHQMALSQISRHGNPKAKEYFVRKVSEGKNKSQALVCLRRQLVTIVWMMMKHHTIYKT